MNGFYAVGFLLFGALVLIGLERAGGGWLVVGFLLLLSYLNYRERQRQ